MAKKRRKTGGIFILILLFIIAVTVALTTPVFNITSVTVTGNARLTSEEILSAAGIPVGTNIYRVSMKSAGERIEAMPYILEAEVKRRFPAKVVISVTEREEATAVKCTGGYAVVDKNCRVLRLCAEEEASIPVASGANVESAQLGQDIVMKDERFVGDLKTMLAALEMANLEVEVRRIRLESAVEIILETRPGLEIHLGGMDELSYKLQLCRNILHGGNAGINKDSSGVLRWTSEGQFSYRQSKN